jgi:DNA repair protein RadC
MNKLEILHELKDISSARQEHMLCLTLNASFKLIAKHTVFIGTVSGMIVHPREVFAVALADRASAIIIAHNHPSGDVEPSEEDIKTTQQFEAAGQILGIRLYDHIIVSGGKHYSFRDDEQIFKGAYAEPKMQEVAV